MHYKNKLVLLGILFIGLFLRLYGINWDQGFHLHPDERMLIMVADRIHFFDALNPQFFNYGSLPVYLLKGLSQLIDYFAYANVSDYQGMLYVGRGLSVFFDLVTVFLIYRIGTFVFKKPLPAYAASFLYAIAFFPIQNSHFFVVDVLLNMLTTLLVYVLLVYSQGLGWKKAILTGVVSAALMATKFTSIIFVGLAALCIVITQIKIKKWKIGVLHLSLFILSFLLFHFLFMPYAFIENARFIADIRQQTAMGSDPYVFPYTLQYVGTAAYFYYLKNIAIWGMGPFITLMSIVGFIGLVINKKRTWWMALYLIYFIVVGRTAVKFMRYMLPFYPFLAICAGYGFAVIVKRSKYMVQALTIGALIWSYLFVNIYSLPHTRITASDWILSNIPKGSQVTTEHWDDVLPLTGSQYYQMSQLALYEQPDNAEKWKSINRQLQTTDYIIIASNRLYTPLQRLVDCKKYKLCYPQTAKYYQQLFAGKLGFEKVAEFSSYPHIHIGSRKLEVPDDAADESFTVYDHPKILIFKKKGS